MNSSKKSSSLSIRDVTETKQSLLQLSHRLRMQIPCELFEINREKFAKMEDIEDELNTLASLRLANLEHVVALLKRVEAAIKRINDGRYGLCEQCGKEIDPQLLLDDITQSTCRDCRKTPEE